MSQSIIREEQNLVQPDLWLLAKIESAFLAKNQIDWCPTEQKKSVKIFNTAQAQIQLTCCFPSRSVSLNLPYKPAAWAVEGFLNIRAMVALYSTNIT